MYASVPTLSRARPMGPGNATHKRPAARQSLVVRAENKVVREYREGDDTIVVTGAQGGSAEQPQEGKPASEFADEQPEVRDCTAEEGFCRASAAGMDASR